MRLTIVGCSGSISGIESASSCYLLDASQDGQTTSILLDLGSGALGQLLRYVSPHKLDAVLLSHLHADHVADMAALAAYWNWVPGPPHLARLPVWGPLGTAERLANLCDDGTVAQKVFEVGTLEDRSAISVGPIQIHSYSARHPVPAFSFRLTGPSENGAAARTLTYTGDSDLCASLFAASSRADLLLAEAGFEGREERGIHLNGRRAGKLANECSAKRVVLTHIPPWASPAAALKGASGECGGIAELASPGDVYKI